MLPVNLKRFFWDADFNAISPESNKSYIIARLLELGDDMAVKWLQHFYPVNILKEVAETARSLSPKSRNYWKIKYATA